MRKPKKGKNWRKEKRTGKPSVILAAMLIASLISGFWNLGIISAMTPPGQVKGNLGQPFQYPDLPKREITPDYLLAEYPDVSMDGDEAVLNFETAVAIPKAMVYFGLYLPDQEIKVPQYRSCAIEDLDGESTVHMVNLKISQFEEEKYDACDFAENGGMVAYRIELYHPQKATSVFYEGRFRVDGGYNLIPCVTEGPFVDIVTSSDSVISWEASHESNGEVRINGQICSDGNNARHHEVIITGLSPDTEYEYDVLVDGIEDIKRYHFRTAPLTDSKFQFALMSDSREGVGGGERSHGGVNYRILGEFLIDAYSSGAEFILFGGDLVNGYTTSVDDFRMQLQAWKDAAEQIGAYIPIYEGIGNHEALMDCYDDGSTCVQFDKRDGDGKSAEAVFAEEFVNPANCFPAPEHEEAPSYAENVYYFDYGNTRVISFNTNYWWCSDPEEYGGNLEGYVMDNQLEWIGDALDDAENNASIEHIFLFGHEPAFPNGGHLGDAQWYNGQKGYVVERRDELWEAIGQNGKVVAVFFGDEHNYNRMLVNRDTPVHLDGSANPNFAHPVWQIISGGAGAPFYAQEGAPWSDYVEVFYPSVHYCLISVDGKNVSMKVKSDTGEIVDEVPLKPFPAPIPDPDDPITSGKTEKVVIAHRGASGYLPEHTLEGYAMAYALGADYIEPDLVMTKDGAFICLHDICLDYTTNVKEVFPDRNREDGCWYAADFTLAEIKQLEVHELCRHGVPVYPDRFPENIPVFEIPTFAEMIELVQGLDRSTGRDVGIYPEIKHPAWHREEGLPAEERLLSILDQYGYDGHEGNIYVQCFERETLKKLRFELESDLPLVQLIGRESSYDWMVTKEGLDEIATYADGIGPFKTRIEENPDLVHWAHERGLVVHPWTFRADGFPAQYKTFEEELYQFYIVYDVDGLFTDFPDRAARFLQVL